MSLKWQDYIEERKYVMLGKPVFKGTRLSVEFILKQVGAGMTHEALFDQYTSLKPEHLRAAMLYAADIVSMDQAIYSMMRRKHANLADENIARDIVTWLRSNGHDVLFAAEVAPGTTDIQCAESC